MKSQIRCALYDRVSTDLQAQSGLSLNTQKELLTEYAKSHNYKIVGYYSDEGITARKKLQNRKDFLRLLDDIRQDKIDLVLVTKLDRWFRNVRDYHNTQAILEEHHCNWKTILEDYDSTTADGQLKINIMLAVAQNECDRTSERIKVVFEHKKRNQEHLNGPVSYGYKVVDKHLHKDENTCHIVEDIFQYYFSSLSKRKTIAYITDKYGEDGPTKYQINYMLTSEVYAGMRYRRPGYCEPYITEEQHELILHTCSSRTYAATNEPYLFSMLLKCPHCNNSLTGRIKRRKCKDGSITCTKQYRCQKKDYKPHRSPCISESVIESYLLENLYPELQSKIYELKQQQKAAPKTDNSWKYRSEMDRLNILFQKGRIDIDYYDSEYARLETALKEEQDAQKIVTLENYEALQKKISLNWKELYDKLDYEHKRTFWKSTVKQIYIDPETHKINGFDFLPCGCIKN